MDASRYPLTWPAGWPRSTTRKRAQFGTKRPGDYKRDMTVATACQRLMTELRRLGVLEGDAILSTNIRTRLDGWPVASAAEPVDPGAAVYFVLFEQERVLACDRWTRVADNITAIAAHIQAIRAIERYGVGSLEQAFAGYTSLPAKGGTWRATLGFGPDDRPAVEEIDRAFRDRARTLHPDAPGGSHDAMAALTAAKADAYREIEAGV